MAISDPKELGEAIKRGDDSIEIEGDLTKKVLKIKATGTVAWAVAIGAIGIGVAAIIAAPATGGISTTASFVAAPAAVGILGGGATVAAITIAVAAGGIGSLNLLRKYKVEKVDGNKVILRK